MAKLVGGPRQKIAIFPVENCFWKFARTAELWRHIRVAHDFDNEECRDNYLAAVEGGSFGCPEPSCLKTYHAPGSLSAHLEKAHRILLTTDEIMKNYHPA